MPVKPPVEALVLAPASALAPTIGSEPRIVSIRPVTVASTLGTSSLTMPVTCDRIVPSGA